MPSPPQTSTPRPEGEEPVASQLAYWIATVLNDAREKAHVKEEEAATTLGVVVRTIRRLENRDGEAPTLGRDINRYVAAYAWLLGMDDGRDLWERALKRWRSHGTAPVFTPSDAPAEAFAAAIRRRVLDASRDDPGTSSERPARRRKETGR